MNTALKLIPKFGHSPHFNVIALIACLFFSAILTAAPPEVEGKLMKTSSPTTSLDGIAAIVNNDVITLSELEKQERKIRSHIATRQIQVPKPAELRAQVLDYLINRKIELQTAARAGIVVDDETLNAAIENIAGRNGLTIEQLKQTVTSDGLNFAEYQDEIRSEMTIERLLQREVGSRITISKQEVDKYLHSIAYEQQNVREYRLEDILIALPEIPSSAELQAAQKTADTIREKLKNGQSFAELAIAKSNGHQALSGGDLGWRRLEEIPSIFTTTVPSMRAGEVAGPLRGGNGLHLIKLVAIRGNNTAHHSTETHARHILIKTNAFTPDETIKEKLTKIKGEIENGKSFAEMARTYSEDTVSALKGGDLGWITPGMLVEPFEKAMNQLKPGFISNPVKTQFGWHIIQVDARRDKDDTAEYEEQQIRRRIFERQYEDASHAWIKRMRDASYVQVFIPPS
jgi:peptidyl-prolyl cis-trans isomerase SurA